MVQRYEIILNLPKKLVEINKNKRKSQQLSPKITFGVKAELLSPLATRISNN
jgi:hypothetical protein